MERKTAYIIVAIRKFAEHYALSGQEAYRYLKQYAGVAFLDDNQYYFGTERALTYLKRV